MNLSRRSLAGYAGALLAATALAGCAVPATTVITDAQAVASDAAAVLALGIVPQPAAGIAQLVLTGFQALLGAVSGSIAAGASTETTVITSLTSSMKSLQASVPAGSPVSTDAGTALTLLGNLQANSAGTTQQQVEAAVGSALIAYLELNTPQKAMLGGAPSPVFGLVADARKHLVKMQG